MSGTTRIQEFDYSINLLRALLWQDNAAPNLTGILQAKQAWYDSNVSTFWEDWVTDVFDINTANEFGLAVWAIILGIPTTVILPPTTKANFGFGLPLCLLDPANANSTWVASGGATLTGGVTDPNGNTQAIEINLSASGTKSVAQQTVASGIPSGTVTLTFQAQLASGTQGTIESAIDGQTQTWPALTSAWQTVTLTFDNADAGTTVFDLVYNSTSTAVVNVWNPQIVAGSIADNGNLNFNNGNFGSLSSTPANLTTDQIRILLLLRYFKLTCLPSVTVINEGLKRIFGSQGGVYVLDGLNMTYVTYVFGFQPDSALSFILNNFDVLPRPAAVGVRYVVSIRPTFGFGSYNQNFNNGTFGS